MLLADRGYDADWIRMLVCQRGAWANIPPKRNRTEALCFSPYLYRARNLVERFFNKIKQCRRVATRYDKLAANYLAFIQLACECQKWQYARRPLRSPPSQIAWRLCGRVEDGRGRLGHAATRRFPSPLVEPDVPITGIRLSDWLHREAHNGTVRGRRSRRSRPSPP
jgi:hypothetical protein